MKARAFNYFLREGFRSFCKNGLMSMASVVTVTLCLILFGIYMLFSVNLNYAAAQVEASYEIQVFIADSASAVPSRTERMKHDLAAIANVNAVTFVSKEEALAGWKAQFGDNAEILEGLELDNPLRDSYKVTVKDLAAVGGTVSEIERLPDVGYVKNNKDAMDKLVRVTSVVQSISFWFMIIFALISVFIISNAIRITVFARRREVNIMKFVGATDWFISFPFMIEGIIIGILGAAAALLIVSQAYRYGLNSAGLLFGETIRLYRVGAVFHILFASLTGMGIVLGAAGSAVSLRRHLHV
jgi:cell division transport system permease protein